jgi:hypothetical protein
MTNARAAWTLFVSIVLLIGWWSVWPTRTTGSPPRKSSMRAFEGNDDR